MPPFGVKNGGAESSRGDVAVSLVVTDVSLYDQKYLVYPSSSNWAEVPGDTWYDGFTHEAKECFVDPI